MAYVDIYTIVHDPAPPRTEPLPPLADSIASGIARETALRPGKWLGRLRLENGRVVADDGGRFLMHYSHPSPEYGMPFLEFRSNWSNFYIGTTHVLFDDEHPVQIQKAHDVTYDSATGDIDLPLPRGGEWDQAAIDAAHDYRVIYPLIGWREYTHLIQDPQSGRYRVAVLA